MKVIKSEVFERNRDLKLAKIDSLVEKIKLLANSEIAKDDAFYDRVNQLSALASEVSQTVSDLSSSMFIRSMNWD